MNPNLLPFIPKEHPDLPDHYGIKIHYITGKSEDFEGIHFIVKDTSTIEIITSDDLFRIIPFSSILKIELDKRFSKSVEINRQITAEKNRKNKEEQELPK